MSVRYVRIRSLGVVNVFSGLAPIAADRVGCAVQSNIFRSSDFFGIGFLMCENALNICNHPYHGNGMTCYRGSVQIYVGDLSDTHLTTKEAQKEAGPK